MFSGYSWDLVSGGNQCTAYGLTNHINPWWISIVTIMCRNVSFVQQQPNDKRNNKSHGGSCLIK